MYATYPFACFFVDRLRSSSSRSLTKEVERWIGFQGGIRTKGARCRCFASLSDDIIADPRRSSGGSLLLFKASWRRKESCDAVECSIGPCDEHDETRSRQATAPIIMRSLVRAIPCRTLSRDLQSTEGINGSMDPPITERSRRSPWSWFFLLLKRMRYRIRRPSADCEAIERCFRMTTVLFTVCYMYTQIAVQLTWLFPTH